MITHWTDDYISLKWSNTFNCWHFVVKVMREQANRIAPMYAIPDLRNKKQTAQAMKKGLSCWKRLAKPVNLCLVALSKSKVVHHVGIYIAEEGGMIMHCNEGQNVTIETLTELRSKGWNKIEFYD